MCPGDIDRLITDDRPLGSGITPGNLVTWTPTYIGSTLPFEPIVYTFAKSFPRYIVVLRDVHVAAQFTMQDIRNAYAAGCQFAFCYF